MGLGFRVCRVSGFIGFQGLQGLGFRGLLVEGLGFTGFGVRGSCWVDIVGYGYRTVFCMTVSGV